jgi:hypothetical protein
VQQQTCFFQRAEVDDDNLDSKHVIVVDYDNELFQTAKVDYPKPLTEKFAKIDHFITLSVYLSWFIRGLVEHLKYYL